MYIDRITNNVPMRNWRDNVTSNKYTDTMQEMTMAADVANPLRILSAYLTTMATRMPPSD